MQNAALTRFLLRALAIAFVVIVHAFVLNIPHPPSVELGFAYGASAVCLAVAAGLLWRRTMD